MNSFIYDKYGYYSSNENDFKFEYKNWHFELELTTMSNEELLKVKEFLTSIPYFYKDKAADVIFSRDKKLVINSLYGNVTLIAVKNSPVEVEDFLSFPFNFSHMGQGKQLKVSYLKDVWINKTDNIEEKVLSRLKLDNFAYKTFMKYYIFNSGLAENAIQYLSDIIYLYGDNINNLTLTHKRIKNLTSYTFLNPMNFIIDFKGRDLSQLIKNNLLDINKLPLYLKKMNFTKQEASLLLARLLYPTGIYDLLEEHYLIKKDIKEDLFKYENNIDYEIKKLKYVYSLLIDIYGIKPIEWINEI